MRHFNCTNFLVHAWIACRFRYHLHAYFKAIVVRLHAHSLSRWETIILRYIEKYALELLKSEFRAYHFKS